MQHVSRCFAYPARLALGLWQQTFATKGVRYQVLMSFLLMCLIGRSSLFEHSRVAWRRVSRSQSAQNCIQRAFQAPLQANGKTEGPTPIRADDLFSLRPLDNAPVSIFIISDNQTGK
jgi:hypothetical protein